MITGKTWIRGGNKKYEIGLDKKKVEKYFNWLILSIGKIKGVNCNKQKKNPWSLLCLKIKEKKETRLESKETQRDSSYTLMKLPISSFSASIFIFSGIASFRNRLLAAICFFSGICLTSKSNNQIKAIYFIINTLKISVSVLFSWEIKMLASILKIK